MENIMNELLEKQLSNPDYHPVRYLQQIQAMKSNLDRMNFVYKELEKYDMFPDLLEDKKDDAIAIKKRETGNEFYRLGKDRKALKCYTESVLTAESPAVMALAYANRSAALLKLKLYKECLQDIDRTFENDYPEDLKPKLLARKEKVQTHHVQNCKHYEPVPTMPDSEKNSVIECARNSVQILKNKKYGQHVVATRNIEIGEVVAVERPYVAIVKDHKHCHECLELCYNLTPCPSCTKAMYCSEDCRKKAYDTYHNYECRILLSLNWLFDHQVRMALRSVLIAKNDLVHFETLRVHEPNEVYRSNRFKEVYNLQGRVDKRDPRRVYSRVAEASVVYNLVKNHTTFIQDGCSEDRLKELLFLLVCICTMNTVDINDLCSNMLFRLGGFAAAVYSFFALFKHSCCPNVTRPFHGSSVVLRAISPIKKGEQCFVTYGPHFTTDSKACRQRELKEYLFTCDCRACKEDWPTNAEASAGIVNGRSMMKLVMSDVNKAERELEEFIKKIKKAEKDISLVAHARMKVELIIWYHSFGNKRRV